MKRTVSTTVLLDDGTEQPHQLTTGDTPLEIAAFVMQYADNNKGKDTTFVVRSEDEPQP
jgi:hypothetical protein